VKNEERFIGRCLESLISQNVQKNLYQVIVVDGKSTDKTTNIVNEYIKKYPSLIKLCENSKEWQSAGRNVAIKTENRSNLFAYIDGHCIADCEWLKNLYKSYRELGDPMIGGIGSIHKSPKDEQLFGKAIEQVFCSFLGGFGSSYRPSTAIKKVHTVPFALYNKEALMEVGFYDEDLRYGEDFSLNFKLRNKGFNIYVEPKAVVYYYKRNSLFSFSKQMFNYGVAKAIILKRYPSAVGIMCLIPSISIVFLIVSIVLSVYLGMSIIVISIIALYLLMVYFSTTISVISEKQLTYINSMPKIYITQHFSFGFGFLFGLAKKGW
jgi:glycosyltransferase involved in cell wall biosynthesis